MLQSGHMILPIYLLFILKGAFFSKLFKILVLIGGQLRYGIVMVSATHQHESAVGTHTSPAS